MPVYRMIRTVFTLYCTVRIIRTLALVVRRSDDEERLLSYDTYSTGTVIHSTMQVAVQYASSYGVILQSTSLQSMSSRVVS